MRLFKDVLDRNTLHYRYTSFSFSSSLHSCFCEVYLFCFSLIFLFLFPHLASPKSKTWHKVFLLSMNKIISVRKWKFWKKYTYLRNYYSARTVSSYRRDIENRLKILLVANLRYWQHNHINLAHVANCHTTAKLAPRRSRSQIPASFDRQSRTRKRVNNASEISTSNAHFSDFHDFFYIGY